MLCLPVILGKYLNFMRKVSREMDSKWALEIMRKTSYITVSFTKPNSTTYEIPLSLTSNCDDIWYFYCALGDDKFDVIAVNPEVCLSTVTKCQPTVGPKNGTK